MASIGFPWLLLAFRSGKVGFSRAPPWLLLALGLAFLGFRGVETRRGALRAPSLDRHGVGRVGVVPAVYASAASAGRAQRAPTLHRPILMFEAVLSPNRDGARLGFSDSRYEKAAECRQRRTAFRGPMGHAPLIEHFKNNVKSRSPLGMSVEAPRSAPTARDGADILKEAPRSSECSA